MGHSQTILYLVLNIPTQCGLLQPSMMMTKKTHWWRRKYQVTLDNNITCQSRKKGRMRFKISREDTREHGPLTSYPQPCLPAHTHLVWPASSEYGGGQESWSRKEGRERKIARGKWLTRLQILHSPSVYPEPCQIEWIAGLVQQVEWWGQQGQGLEWQYWNPEWNKGQ